MTNINCAKHCKFQSDGKCCCDSILQSKAEGITGDADCPYLNAADTKEKALEKNQNR